MEGPPSAGSFLRKSHSVDENTILDQLEELIEKFGVQIRHDAIKQDEDSVHAIGGLCVVRGEYVLILNSKATVKEKIWTLGIALKQLDYEHIYIRPVLRDLLDKIPDQRRLTMKGKPEPKI
jgi:hypothetical protein